MIRVKLTLLTQLTLLHSFCRCFKAFGKVDRAQGQMGLCTKCDLSFQMMKDFMISAPILKYPDTTKPYTIFTDTSKYGWACVLTQEHTSVVDGKEVTTNHPVSFVSGMFQGSQLNWAAMVKERSLHNLYDS